MINHDEDLLLKQRVDPNYNEPVLHQVLRIAMYDEYHAHQTYAKVIDTFGPSLPFTNIIGAEQRHISALQPLFAKYGVEVPVDNWYDKIELPDTLVECCEVGVAAEIENIRMYDNLLQYTTQPDIIDVFYRLQAASFNNHLPAFRQCLAAHYQQLEIGNAQAQGMQNDPSFFAQNSDMFNFASNLASGNFDSGSFAKLLTGDQKELILGALMGAGLTMALSSDMLKEIFNHEKEN